MIKILLSVVLTTFITANAWAGAVTVPNTFTAGTTSSAEQVKANFTAVKTTVDDNFARVVPVGAMMPFAGATAPAGWLLCNGAAVSRTVTYASLFTAIGVAWGSGDGTTTFNLPDMRGRFARGVDAAAGNDPDAAARTASNAGGNAGDAVGSLQADAFQGHNHIGGSGTYMGTTAGGVTNYSQNSGINSWTTNGITDHASYGVARPSTESRPKNVGVNYIIKF